MIKFEYKPNVIDTPFGALDDPPPVESVTMTLGGDVSWDEAVCEFKNFLRAAGYVIPYDFEDDYVDCSDPPDMDKSGSLGDRQPEWAMRMSGPDKWWNDESNTGVASEDEGNTDVAENKHIKSEQTHNTKSEVTYDPETGEPLIDGYPLYSGLPNREWVGLTYNEIIDTGNEFQVLDKGESERWFDLVGYASAIEAKLKEKNT